MCKYRLDLMKLKDQEVANYLKAQLEKHLPLLNIVDWNMDNHGVSIKIVLLLIAHEVEG